MSKCPHCLSDLDAAKGKPRSLDQLRRFFSVLRAMYSHWPETVEQFQPHSEEHLRKWILCKAGHGTVVQTLTMPRTSNPSLMAALMSFAEQLLEIDNRFGRWKGSTLAVYEAKSIAFHKLGQAEFNRINDDVEAAYKEVTGLDADEVLKQTESAA